MNYIHDLKLDPGALERFIDHFQEITKPVKNQVSFTLIFLTELYLLLTEDNYSNQYESIFRKLIKDIPERFGDSTKLDPAAFQQLNEGALHIIDQDDLDYDFLLFLTIRQTPEHEIESLLDFQMNVHDEDFPNYVKIYLPKYATLLNEVQQQIVRDWSETAMTEMQMKSTVANAGLEKINWLGTQKELGELLIELKKNGWIGEMPYKTIKAAFTESKSIDQYLKPSTDRRTKKNTYDKVYTPKYKPKFEMIQQNHSVQ